MKHIIENNFVIKQIKKFIADQLNNPDWENQYQTWNELSNILYTALRSTLDESLKDNPALLESPEAEFVFSDNPYFSGISAAYLDRICYYLNTNKE